eukprot:TRINITY_DN1472_c1_g1_i1.p1 TRINITY_DN1472_c1_g1~~TRINITY_DN1472_c1_g1_i1.p1  ORF type:complete len:1188 (+),score=400.85 TRINITY_DN1472_c1_g1_i1:87-3650(+)
MGGGSSKSKPKEDAKPEKPPEAPPEKRSNEVKAEEANPREIPERRRSHAEISEKNPSEKDVQEGTSVVEEVQYITNTSEDRDDKDGDETGTGTRSNSNVGASNLGTGTGTGTSTAAPAPPAPPAANANSSAAAATNATDNDPDSDDDDTPVTPPPPPPPDTSNSSTKKSDKQRKRKLLNGPNIEFLYPSGSKYTGGFKDGKLHGYGKYTYYPSGDEYEGEWWNDMKHGHGSYTYESGDKYVGEWRYGKKHGKGNYTFASGDEYVGSWKADRIHGYGVFLIVRNGNRYEGEWEDSYRHGYGVLISGNGDRYEGHWVRGKEEGHGVLSYVNGNHYCGEWKLGQMDGKGVLIDKSGTRHLVEHISGYMISNIPADGEPDPDWAAVWQLAEMHQKKLSNATKEDTEQSTTNASSEVAKLKMEKEILERKYNDMLTAKSNIDTNGIVGEEEEEDEEEEEEDGEKKKVKDKSLQDKVGQLMHQIAVDERKIKEYQSREESMKASLQELNFTKQQLTESSIEVETLRSEIGTMRQTGKSDTAGADSAKVKALQKELAEAKNKIHSMQGTDILELQAKLELAEGAAGHVDSITAERNDLQHKHTALKEQSAAWKERESDLVKEIKDLKEKLLKASERLEATQAQHVEEVDSTAADLQQKLDEKEAKLKENDEKYKKLKKRQKEFEIKSKNQDELLQRKEAETEELQKLRKEMGALQDASSKLQESEQELTALKVSFEQLTEEGEVSRQKMDAMQNAQTEAVRKASEMEDQYKQEKIKARKYFNTIEDMKGKIRVYARTRPLVTSEVQRKDRKVLQFPDEMSVVVADEKMKEKKEFIYDSTFPEDSTQEAIFEDCKHLVQSAVDGYNVCIFAYGQTGSGKTFTLAGTDEQPGVAPRSMSELWNLLNSISGTFDVSMTCSMVELYNDKLYDLLRDQSLDPVRLDIKKDARGTVTINGVVSQGVENLSELERYYHSGQLNRHTRATKMNDLSSRSHLIFSIIIETTNKETKQTSIGKLSIVDLAGSERLAKTGVEDPTAVAEAQSINLSLTALGNVISALSSGKGHIPYRDNKLTMLMSDSIGGNAKTLMFVNISPASYNTEETVNSLKYASRVKLITNSPAKAIETSEIKRLKAAIEKLKQGIYTDVDQMEIENTVIDDTPVSPHPEQKARETRSLSAGGRKTSRTPSPLPPGAKPQ